MEKKEVCFLPETEHGRSAMLEVLCYWQQCEFFSLFFMLTEHVSNLRNHFMVLNFPDSKISTSYTKLRPFNFSFSLQLLIMERIRKSKEILPYSNGTSDEKDSKNSKSYPLGQHVTSSILWWTMNTIWQLLTMLKVHCITYTIYVVWYCHYLLPSYFFDVKCSS